MTKRLLLLVLVCILAVPLLAFPASATGAYDQEISEDVQDIKEKLYVFYSEFAVFIDDVWGPYIQSIRDNLANTAAWIKEIRDEISAQWEETNDYLNLTMEAVGQILNGVNLNIEASLLIQETLSQMHTTLGVWGSSIQTSIDNLKASMDDWLQDIYVRQNDILTQVKNHATAFRQFVSEFFDPYLGEIISRLGAVRDHLAALIGIESDAADDFNHQAATDATEWGDALDEIEQATMPDFEDIDPDLEIVVDPDGVSGVGDLLKLFFENTYIYVVFLLAFTFSLISYTIFGKR